jgi:hypothetical protein
MCTFDIITSMDMNEEGLHIKILQKYVIYMVIIIHCAEKSFETKCARHL